MRQFTHECSWDSKHNREFHSHIDEVCCFIRNHLLFRTDETRSICDTDYLDSGNGSARIAVFGKGTFFDDDLSY